MLSTNATYIPQLERRRKNWTISINSILLKAKSQNCSIYICNSHTHCHKTNSKWQNIMLLISIMTYINSINLSLQMCIKKLNLPHPPSIRDIYNSRY